MFGFVRTSPLSVSGAVTGISIFVQMFVSRSMNKGRRNELAALKKKKRIKRYKGALPTDRWTNVLKSHATPCSCEMCSHRKYNRAKFNRGLSLKEIIGDNSRGWANEKP